MFHCLSISRGREVPCEDERNREIGSTESIYASSWNQELYQLLKLLSAFCLRVIYTSVYDSIKNSGPFFGYYFFIALLMMLQILHVYWFCLILRMLSSFLFKGQVWRPDRVSSQHPSLA